MSSLHLQENHILGLDIGSNSVGWVLFDAPNGNPLKIIDAGSRIFEAGINMDESGEKASKNKDRRDARGRRRLLKRRAARMSKLLHALQRIGLLPEGDLHGHLNKETDNDLENLYLSTDPYELRTKALDKPLTPHELGRAIYHLARRRGFLSNRKAPQDNDEDAGKVKASTAALEKEWQEAGARTLGEYLNSMDPHDNRRRGRYTLRRWFQDELTQIWQAQEPHHKKILTENNFQLIYKIIFHQRPLKSQNRFIGKCELEAFGKIGPKRAAMASLIAQRFRLLQMVNDTLIVDNNDTNNKRPLTEEERACLLYELEQVSKLTFTKARKLLGKQTKGTKFNFETAGRKEFLGNRTAAQLRGVFGDTWDDFTAQQQNQAVEDIVSIHKEETLINRGINHWGLDQDQAKKLAHLSPESGYHRYSRKAIKKLLPHLEGGKNLYDALEIEYPQRTSKQIYNTLPPVEELRNPIVQRALTETRKVVNAIIREYGKPGIIKLELARDLKKNQKQRDEIVKKNRNNERARQKAREAIAKLTGNQDPSRYLIEKYLLAEECKWMCPYTGKSISANNLFGESPDFDIEHIIPFSRSLDNSFLNKTLCYNDENRSVKRNRTPWETYGAPAMEGNDPKAKTKWDAILDRLAKFPPDTKGAKLHRFKMKTAPGEAEFIESFAQRQLSDTRYASKKAREIISCLYGDEWRKRVQVCAGGVTAWLRGGWDLNKVLNSDGMKNRDDHRHHTIDAICVALTTHGMVHQLAKASKYGEERGRPGVVRDLPAPWDGFLDDVKKSVGDIKVSHRIDRKVRGPLHKEKHYGKIHNARKQVITNSEQFTVIRRKMEELSKEHLGRVVDQNNHCIYDVDIDLLGTVRKNGKDLTDVKIIGKSWIIDKAVRVAVNKHLDNLDPSLEKALKMVKDSNNHPFMTTKQGRKVPIHKVRVRSTSKPSLISHGDHKRYVNLENNHHVAIYGCPEKGKGHFEVEIITLIDAIKRKQKKEEIVAQVNKNGLPLAFYLMKNDVVSIPNKPGYFIMICISWNYYEFKSLACARLKKDLRGTDDYVAIRNATSLSKVTKKQMTLLGKVR